MATGFGLAALITSVMAMFAPLSINLLLISAATLMACIAALGSGRGMPIATVLLSFVNLFFMSPLTLVSLGLQGIGNTKGNEGMLGVVCLLMASPVVAIAINLMAKRQMAATPNRIAAVSTVTPPLTTPPSPEPPSLVHVDRPLHPLGPPLRAHRDERPAPLGPPPSTERKEGFVATREASTPERRPYTGMRIAFAFLGGLIVGAVGYHVLRADMERLVVTALRTDGPAAVLQSTTVQTAHSLAVSPPTNLSGSGACRQFDVRAISQVVGREVIGVSGLDECRVEFGKLTGSRDYIVIRYTGRVSTPEDTERWFREFPCPPSYEKRSIANLGQSAQVCASTAVVENQTNSRVMHLIVRQGGRTIWMQASQQRQSGMDFERVDLETTLRLMARQVVDAG